MEWLAQNWLWLLLIIGVIMMLSRGRHGAMMGGCCARDTAREGPVGEDKTTIADAPHPSINERKAGASRGGCH
jgi:hypothetical protein